uniref:Uncharacterized protein n=1 Tax=Ascaris lumbricoides TaxID=6252 RepID=A0A0M3I975_ASCLU
MSQRELDDRKSFRKLDEECERFLFIVIGICAKLLLKKFIDGRIIAKQSAMSKTTNILQGEREREQPEREDDKKKDRTYKKRCTDEMEEKFVLNSAKFLEHKSIRLSLKFPYRFALAVSDRPFVAPRIYRLSLLPHCGSILPTL